MAKRQYRRSGTVRWLNDKGHNHRLGGPASVWPDGTQWWFSHGRLHFAHGPTVRDASGTQYWYEDGWRLREREPYG